MTQDQNGTAGAIPPAANDNGAGKEEAARHLRTIARAVGRHIAREHFRAWERRRQRAANDNRVSKQEGGARGRGAVPEG